MPRRFALALLGLLVLLLLTLVLGRSLKGPVPSRALVPAKPTPEIPPTPIPGRRVAVYFESAKDQSFHPEERELPAAADDVAFVRSVAAAVLQGPSRSELLRPFPPGWTLRGAYRLGNGLVVLDLLPGVPAKDGSPPPRWETGSHEEEAAAQALVISIVKNVTDATHVVLLVGGEPAETLGGHLDLTHPLAPDLKRAVDERALEATPPPTATPLAAPPASPAASAPALTPTPVPARPGPRTDAT